MSGSSPAPEETSAAALYAAFQRNLLLEATLEEMLHNPEQVTFAAIIKRSLVPRASAYRLFSNGIDGLKDELWGEVLQSVSDRTQAEIDLTIAGRPEASIKYVDAVYAGAVGVIAGICDARYIREVLHPQGRMMPTLLYADRPTSMVCLIAEFAALCARKTNRDLDDQALAKVKDLSGYLAISLVSFIYEHRSEIAEILEADEPRRAEAMKELIEWLRKDETVGSRIEAFVKGAGLEDAWVSARSEELAKAFVPEFV